MTRRELLQELGGALAVTNLGVSSPAGVVESLPGTQPLTWDGDLAERLMALTSFRPPDRRIERGPAKHTSITAFQLGFEQPRAFAQICRGIENRPASV